MDVSNGLKKPKAPPKPLILSTISKTPHKIKPPLLPKPRLIVTSSVKAKSILCIQNDNSKTSVSISNSGQKTITTGVTSKRKFKQAPKGVIQQDNFTEVTSENKNDLNKETVSAPSTEFRNKLEMFKNIHNQEISVHEKVQKNFSISECSFKSLLTENSKESLSSDAKEPRDSENLKESFSSETKEIRISDLKNKFSKVTNLTDTSKKKEIFENISNNLKNDIDKLSVGDNSNSNVIQSSSKCQEPSPPLLFDNEPSNSSQAEDEAINCEDKQSSNSTSLIVTEKSSEQASVSQPSLIQNEVHNEHRRSSFLHSKSNIGLSKLSKSTELNDPNVSQKEKSFLKPCSSDIVPCDSTDSRRFSLDSTTSTLISSRNSLSEHFLTDGDKLIPSELNNGLDRLISNNIVSEELNSNSKEGQDNHDQFCSNNEYDTVYESHYETVINHQGDEPIYEEIGSNVPSDCESYSQDYATPTPYSQSNEIEYGNMKIRNDEDYHSDLSDLSDGSEVSSSSFEHVPSTPSYSLVDGMRKLGENLTFPACSSVSFNVIHSESELTPVKKQSMTSIRRSWSDRSIKSRQEDTESLESNSTEGLVKRRLSNWFGSFGKGGKRPSSQFYFDSSPDQSCSSLNIEPVGLEVDIVKDIHSINKCEGNTLALPNTEPSIPWSKEEILESKKKKAYLAAREIMTSEREYRNALSLICIDMKNYCLPEIPEHEFDKIITDLPQIMCFSEDLLKDLEACINNWATLPKISNVFIKKGSFLKLSYPYLRNYELQCKNLEECCKKYPSFEKKLKEFQCSEKCKGLKVQYYMLKPIQRVVQYRLLMEVYLKHLQSDSVDYCDAQKALEIVSEIADGANESMKQVHQFNKLIQIQNQLRSYYEIIQPGRIFLKEGMLYKLSRKEPQERYFILLSDCLLYTSYYKTMNTTIGLKLHHELPLSNMNVVLTKDSNNEFSIRTKARSFSLQARTSEERREWVVALQGAIKRQLKSFIYPANPDFNVGILNSEMKLGQEAPVWTTDDRASMCYICTERFCIYFRRHHCRACGKVVCLYCSRCKAPLQYKLFNSKRVCESCFDYLMKEFDDPKFNLFERIKITLNLQTDKETKTHMENIRNSFKNYSSKTRRKSTSVPPRLVLSKDSGSQMKGWLLLRMSKRNWKPYWFVLKEQVLYKYKAKEDVAALDSVAVLGYEVETLKEQDNVKHIFQLTHSGQDPKVYGVEDEKLFSKWLSAMKEASVLK